MSSRKTLILIPLVFTFIALAPSGSYAQSDSVVLHQQIEMQQQALDILSKTNESLSEKWTPISILLSALAAFFSLITVLAAAIFAYGLIIMRKIRAERKQGAQIVRGLVDEGQSLVKTLNDNAEELFNKLRDKKDSLADLESQLKSFKEKSEKSIQQLSDKTLVTVSGLASTAGAFNPLLYGGRSSVQSANQDAKVCAKCGTVFYEKFDASDPLSFAYSGSTDIWGKTICSRCKKEGGIW